MATKYIKRKTVKEEFLKRWKERRYHKMTRVAEETLEEIDRKVSLTINKIINEHPSLGKTIKPN